MRSNVRVVIRECRLPIRGLLLMLCDMRGIPVALADRYCTCGKPPISRLNTADLSAKSVPFFDQRADEKVEPPSYAARKIISNILCDWGSLVQDIMRNDQLVCMNCGSSSRYKYHSSLKGYHHQMKPIFLATCREPTI